MPGAGGEREPGCIEYGVGGSGRSSGNSRRNLYDDNTGEMEAAATGSMWWWFHSSETSEREDILELGKVPEKGIECRNGWMDAMQSNVLPAWWLH